MVCDDGDVDCPGLHRQRQRHRQQRQQQTPPSLIRTVRFPTAKRTIPPSSSPMTASMRPHVFPSTPWRSCRSATRTMLSASATARRRNGTTSANDPKLLGLSGMALGNRRPKPRRHDHGEEGGAMGIAFAKDHDQGDIRRRGCARPAHESRHGRPPAAAVALPATLWSSEWRFVTSRVSQRAYSSRETVIDPVRSYS